MSEHSLDVFFNPSSIAVIGASGRPGAFSHEILVNLKRSFKGRLYAVNPKYDQIIGVPSYPKITSIPDTIDLAVIALRPHLVPQAVEEAGQAGVRGVIIVSGGFAETGEEGARLQDEVVRAARRHGVRVVGPNCIGVYNRLSGVDTFFLPVEKMRRPPKGYAAIVSQSGALLTTLMDYMAEEGVGVTAAINIGNKVDVDEAEVIDYYTGMDWARAIVVYVESVGGGEGRRLAEAISNAVEAGKSVVVVKGGKTSQGARAARSHTAALAGDYTVFRDVIDGVGAVIVEGVEAVADAVKALTLQGPLMGSRILVVTNAGGPGVIAVDEITMNGLDTPRTPDKYIRALKDKVHPAASLQNPIDLTGDATDSQYKAVLESGVLDEYDGLLVLAPVQPATVTSRIADIIADAAWRHRTPTVAFTIGAGEGHKVKWYLEARGIPAYMTPERAARALVYMHKAGAERCKPPTTAGGKPPERAAEIVEDAAKSGRGKLLEHEALAVLESYGVDVARYCLASSISDVKRCYSELHPPLVAKIVSPDIHHKSDVGGVVTGIESLEQAVKAYNSIVRRVASMRPGVEIAGVLYQEMVKGGVEVIAGARRDEGFGVITLAGLGGVAVEAAGAVSIGLGPVDECWYRRIASRTILTRLERGFRGVRVEGGKARRLLEAVSRIVSEIPWVSEAEVNPAIAVGSDLIVVDARIILDSERAG